MNNEARSNTPKIVGAVLGIAVIGAAVAWAFGYDRSPEGTDTPSNGPAAAPTAPASAYKDGTYQASGAYVSPAGNESVDIGITLQGDVITDTTFSANSSNPASKFRQDQFAAGYKAQVVGKKIDEVNLGVINGSSLVPIGFMEALTKVKAEARS